MTTYEQAHAGDVVLGHDGQAWGVEQILHEAPGLAVTLVRHGERITGWPPPDTEVTILASAGVAGEAAAAQAFLDAGLGPLTIIGERWNG